MAGLKEIKSRMGSVRETQKITNAMYLIASTKLRKARSELDVSRPYFEALQEEVERIFSTNEEISCPYFEPEDEQLPGERFGCLMITADKGLAGAYNLNVIREAERLAAKLDRLQFYVVGEYGRHYLKHHHMSYDKTFRFTAQNPTMHRARKIMHFLLQKYDDGELDEIYIIFTDMKNGLTDEVRCQQLLPLHRGQFHREEKTNDQGNFVFEPSVNEVLNAIMPSYLTGFIYSALVDSSCCEQNARMTAMNNANQNAEKILDDLSIQYNRVRQAAITQEITEVSAGARAHKSGRR